MSALRVPRRFHPLAEGVTFALVCGDIFPVEVIPGWAASCGVSLPVSARNHYEVSDTQDALALFGAVSSACMWLEGWRAAGFDLGSSAQPLRAEQSHAAGRQIEYRRIAGGGNHRFPASEPDVQFVGRWNSNRP